MAALDFNNHDESENCETDEKQNKFLSYLNKRNNEKIMEYSWGCGIELFHVLVAQLKIY